MDGSDDETKHASKQIPSFRPLDLGDLAPARFTLAHDPGDDEEGESVAAARRPARAAGLALVLIAACIVGALAFGSLRPRSRVETTADASGLASSGLAPPSAPLEDPTQRTIRPGAVPDPSSAVVETQPEIVRARPRSRPEIARLKPYPKAVPTPVPQPPPEPMPEPAPLADAAPKALPTLIADPAWSVLPTRADVSRLYPAQSWDNHVDGAATIDCAVAAGGGLMDCRVVEETPRERGFGAATLKLAGRFRMRATTRSGDPAAGRRVRVPVLWRLAEPENGL